MAQFVEPERLWPMLAYFTGAVVVIVASDFVIDAMGMSRDAMLWVVMVWMLVTPVGAWMLWKRTAPDRAGDE